MKNIKVLITILLIIAYLDSCITSPVVLTMKPDTTYKPKIDTTKLKHN